MTTAQARLVQPGWTVFGSDDKRIGIVVSVDAMTVQVKGRRMLTVPAMYVAEAGEGRVELTVPKGTAERHW